MIMLVMPIQPKLYKKRGKKKETWIWVKVSRHHRKPQTDHLSWQAVRKWTTLSIDPKNVGPHLSYTFLLHTHIYIYKFLSRRDNLGHLPVADLECDLSFNNFIGTPFHQKACPSINIYLPRYCVFHIMSLPGWLHTCITKMRVSPDAIW